MKYMLLIYGDETALSEPEREACYVESTQLAHEIQSKGQYLAANPLHPTAMATSESVIAAIAFHRRRNMRTSCTRSTVGWVPGPGVAATG